MLQNQNFQAILTEAILVNVLIGIETDTKNKRKILDLQLKSFKKINALLKNDFIFFNRDLNNDESERSIGLINFLYRILGEAVEILNKATSDDTAKDIKKEYSKLNVHFSDESLVLRSHISKITSKIGI